MWSEIANGVSEVLLGSASWRGLRVCEFLNFIFFVRGKQAMLSVCVEVVNFICC